jgi:hypothetical protein
MFRTKRAAKLHTIMVTKSMGMPRAVYLESVVFQDLATKKAKSDHVHGPHQRTGHA